MKRDFLTQQNPLHNPYIHLTAHLQSLGMLPVVL